MHQEARIILFQNLTEHARVSGRLHLGKIPVDFQHEIKHGLPVGLVTVCLLEKTRIAAWNNRQADDARGIFAGQPAGIAGLLLQPSEITDQIELQIAQQLYILFAQA